MSETLIICILGVAIGALTLLLWHAGRHQKDGLYEMQTRAFRIYVPPGLYDTITIVCKLVDRLEFDRSFPWHRGEAGVFFSIYEGPGWGNVYYVIEDTVDDKVSYLAHMFNASAKRELDDRFRRLLDPAEEIRYDEFLRKNHIKISEPNP